MNQYTPPGTSQSPRGPVSPFARARHRRYVDELIDQYVSWREACAGVRIAYDRWTGAGREDAAVTFAIYATALDREEEAAVAYQAAAARVAAG